MPSEFEQVVYVVDDDADVREGIGALLESIGLEVVALSSTVEFLAQKRADRPSCLVLDVRLPGLSGLDFQATVRTDIPIIFITGHGDTSMAVRAMKAGAVDFLTKPLREQDVLDAVRIALDRDRERRRRKERAVTLRSRFDLLSPREREVMTLLTTGMLNKQVGGELGISEITVKAHRSKVMKKLNAKSFTDLVRMADALGLSRTINTDSPESPNSSAPIPGSHAPMQKPPPLV